MTKYQQPISQITCNSSNKNTITPTHTLESLHMFLESIYELVPGSRKFEKVTIQFIIYSFVIRNFNTNKVQCDSKQYFNQSPE